ncbi:Uncharacterised protein [Yersinia aleksiciae]|uniref:Uncharacterized protein n=1 Tax=Yersinia aleksiciae TaxID=263819 RepID=A0A0T9U091_YERAE|nr:Uncharacterised protein [Yersinia aleksiciae]CNL11946.1 Uncharacterised protein [Yersinia aleksiciae]
MGMVKLGYAWIHIESLFYVYWYIDKSNNGSHGITCRVSSMHLD